MKLWEGLSQDLNYNVMFSQRGVMNLGHTLQDMRDIHRRVNANRLNGIDGEVLDARKQIKEIVPHHGLLGQPLRYPVLGASLAAARRRRPSRRGRLGLCPRRRRAGRGHPAELRSHRHPARAAARSGRRDQPRLHRRQEGRHRRRRPLRRAGEDGRLPLPLEATRCRRWCPSRSSPSSTRW
jgi:hypothetical protein